VDNPLIESLGRAIEASPTDVPLRLHLARLLLDAGSTDEAIALCGAALQLDPQNADARGLIAEALAPRPGNASTLSGAEPGTGIPTVEPGDATVPADRAQDGSAFDWSAAEDQVGHLAPPMFVEGAPTGSPVDAFDAERPSVTLADVGGMAAVKTRLEAAFLAPLRNPELRAVYGKSLGGGLLMYGPPGCGKTFIARAVAGELEATFLSVSASDVLSRWLGDAEANIHEVFQQARRCAPCVLFFDEFDALGQRRSDARHSALRTMINQLLVELDGVEYSNEGVYVLAATNQVWDVDPALRRPGRLDRTVLVLPPDSEAREAIFRTHLRGRPVAGADLGELARRTDGFSGADIAYVCEVASERALLDSVTSGVVRYIAMTDLLAAVAEIRPSTGPWLSTARNWVEFGDDDGTSAELKAFLKRSKRL